MNLTNTSFTDDFTSCTLHCDHDVPTRALNSTIPIPEQRCSYNVGASASQIFADW